MKYLLGYEIGSTTIKVALIHSEDNLVVDVVQYPEHDSTILSKHSGWAEQHPESWWQDLCTATRSLLAINNLNPREIAGIGIAYQMHGLVLVDENKKVLRPSIIWSDSRAVTIGKKAFKDLGEKECLENFLNSPGNFTASKLRWVKDNEPEIYDRIDKIMLPGDYIAMKFTGEVQTTISGLSEAILWDFKRKKIAHQVMDYYEISEDLIPEIVPTFSLQGTVTAEAAEMSGLVTGIPVTYRAGDQPNNALSLNVLNPGEIAATSAESGVVYGIVDRPKYDVRSRVNSFAHINYEDNYDRIGVLLCLNGAGTQYGWMKSQIALSGRHYEDMERMASTVPIGSDELCVLPFGNGAERMLDEKSINSHIMNLEFSRHSRGHLYRAALEGVAFSFVYGMNLLKEMGLEVDILRVTSDNMFQSEIFSMTIATLLDCHIEVVDTTGVIGAARAAGVANGVYTSLEEALSHVKPSIIYEPRLNHSRCSQAYNLWLSHLDKALFDMPSYANRPEVLRSKNEALKATITEKNKELTAVSMQLYNKDEFLLEIKDSLKGLSADLSVEDQKKVLQRLIAKIESKTDSDKDWESFEGQFDLLHSDFFKKLKSDFPKLSVSEAKLCMLLKMKLSTKEIANQLNLSVRGVETRRYRLRKKLQINKELDLEEFLDRV
ncbi:FGGY family carbohydrate kinase [Reichenbachiella agarivorans]|uniref:FGGY family carbohydrate kinase n=1 Tax=Reichenbachiella agarivorans TaxID=2979464 RepID=A0ABY6CQN9_9BACT|nr:FGGY family carbohydrate kinase [Reichenbachiella agarivorans]UXP32350.1 FGGY family carbohydrate kinase [Reichenbachiella agarivorans]